MLSMFDRFHNRVSLCADDQACYHLVVRTFLGELNAAAFTRH